MEQQQLILLDAIPVDVCAATIMGGFVSDVRDLMSLVQVRPNLLSTLPQQRGSLEFTSWRSLTLEEKAWCAAQSIRVILPPAVCTVVTNWPEMNAAVPFQNWFWMPWGTSMRVWSVDGLVLHRDDDLPAVEFSNGQKEWYQLGRRHRDNDQPAVVQANHEEWWMNGELHRDHDRPARVSVDGLLECWYQHSKLHRDNDQPALVGIDGSEWYQHNRRHRDNDRPAIEHANGRRFWYMWGQYHRENDLPAVVRANGDCEWYWEGKRHRDGGLPAVWRVNGNHVWWIHGKCVPKPRC